EHVGHVARQRRGGLLQFDGLAAVVQLATVGTKQWHIGSQSVPRTERRKRRGVGRRIEVHQQQKPSRAERHVRREREVHAACYFPGVRRIGRTKQRHGVRGDIEQLDKF